MPEGPEIRQAADLVQKALQNEKMVEVFFAFSDLKPYEPLFEVATVLRVRTKGKAMLIDWDNGYTIYSHNQLYGKWYVTEAYAYPTTKRTLRLALHTEYKSALLYSASEITVFPTEEQHQHAFLAKAGPDILSEDVTEDQLFNRIQSKTFRNRKWASLLLDQQFVAGNGNYLRSEILFIAGVNPESRPVDCSEEQQMLVAKAMIQLTKQSYETGGITTDLAIADQVKAAGAKWEDYRHWVFNREQAPCHICQTPIKKMMIGGRRLYYCPSCQ